MIEIVSGLIMLCILIVVHELGHFSVAKFFRVKVLTFSVGFGPKIWGKKRGETEYRVSAVPLGGYVQMLGEGPADEAGLDQMSTDDRCRAFAEQPLYRRFCIVAAGPLMNLILPFLVLPLAFMVGMEFPAYLDQQACVAYVNTNTAAAEAGFQEGDCILQVNDSRVANWQKANEALVTYAGEPLMFTVVRGGETLQLTVPAEKADIEGLRSLGLEPPHKVSIARLLDDSQAEVAGMKTGDQFLQVDEIHINTMAHLRDAINAAEGRDVNILYLRDGVEQEVVVTPRRNAEGRWMIGVALGVWSDQVIKKFGLVKSIEAGAQKTFDLIGMTLTFIKKLFSGSVPADKIGGPITVFKFAGDAARSGLATAFLMLGFISIQLGILNLLPIPVLDGGHLFFYLLEFVFRRPLNRRAREIAQQVGLVMLLMLMTWAFYNDIDRLFFGGS